MCRHCCSNNKNNNIVIITVAGSDFFRWVCSLLLKPYFATLRTTLASRITVLFMTAVVGDLGFCCPAEAVLTGSNLSKIRFELVDKSGGYMGVLIQGNVCVSIQHMKN